MATPIFPLRILKSLEKDSPALNPSTPGMAQAIVVLGAGRYFEAPEYGFKDTVKKNVFERIRFAARLHRTTKIPILTSGGAPDGGESTEAELMREVFVEDFHVPVKWVENHSINSMDNAIMSAKILAPLHVKKIFLVTHAMHMPRAKFSFERVGFEVIPAPVGFLTPRLKSIHIRNFIPSMEGIDLSYAAWHEIIGIAWYKIRF